MIEFFSAEYLQQLLIVIILIGGLMFFIRDRFRYDVIALAIMLAIVVSGILSYEEVLSNFGHPIVVIVAAMFIMSSALASSGLVDRIVGNLTFLYTRPFLALAVLCLVVAGISAFVNNIGALAMVIPVALILAQKSRTPVAFFLLPLAMASHFGGFLTLIGNPRNILISDFREDAIGTPFSMFDFTSVGIFVALVGLIFVVVYARLYLPRKFDDDQTDEPTRIFLTEVRVPEGSKVATLTVGKFNVRTKSQVTISQIFRNHTLLTFNEGTHLLPDDVIQLTGTELALTQYIERFGLELTGLRALELHVTNADDHITREVLIPPYSKLVGRSWNTTLLRDRFGTNFLALFRSRRLPRTELGDYRFQANDIILLQGQKGSVETTLEHFSLLPLAIEDVHLGRFTTIIATVTIVVSAILLASLAIAPIAIIFLAAALLLVVTNLISLRRAYESIDFPVIILLAGMITLGEAIQVSGVDDVLASVILSAGDLLSPVAMLALVLVATMAISDFINCTAAAVVMTPVAIMTANGLGVSIDPFLMAAALGASSAFLTPVGHESNALVMQKGGYSFSDFTKMGLPLELLIFIVSLPLILTFWPL